MKKANFALIFFYVLPLHSVALIDFYDQSVKKSPQIFSKIKESERKLTSINLTQNQNLPTVQIKANGVYDFESKQYGDKIGAVINYNFVLAQDEQVGVKKLDYENSLIAIDDLKESVGISSIQAYLAISKIRGEMNQLFIQQKWLLTQVAKASTQDALGEGNKINLHTLKRQLSSIEDQISRQESNYIRALNNLIEIYGYYVEDIYVLDISHLKTAFLAQEESEPQFIFSDQITIEALMEAALKNDASIQTLYNQIKVNQTSLEVAKTADVPSFNLFASVDKTGQNGSLFSSTSNKSDNVLAGWNLTWNIYDQGKTDNAVQNFLIQKEQLDIQLLQTRRLVKKQAHQAYHDLLLLKKRIQTIQKGIVEAEKVYKLREAEYRFDSINISKLLGAQYDVVNFRNLLLSAYIAIIEKQLELKSLMGDFSRNDVLKINTYLVSDSKRNNSQEMLEHHQSMYEKFKVFKTSTSELSNNQFDYRFKNKRDLQFNYNQNLNQSKTVAHQRSNDQTLTPIEEAHKTRYEEENQSNFAEQPGGLSEEIFSTRSTNQPDDNNRQTLNFDDPTETTSRHLADRLIPLYDLLKPNN